MSKHDLKAVKLQVERFVSKVLGRIFSDVPILYSSDDFDLTDPRSLITRGLAETMFGNGRPDVSLWDGSPIDIDKYVTHPIDGIEYLFRSLVDDNISEPTLSAGIQGAWTQRDDYGTVPLFNISNTYNTGELVRSTNSASAPVYESIGSGNIGNIPPADGVSDSNWKFIGHYEANWSSSQTYELNAVVYDPSSDPIRRRYVSNKDNNTSPLSDNLPGSTWRLVGIIISDNEVSLTKTWSSQKISDAIAGGSSSSLTFDQDDIDIISEGIYSLSFNLPDGKSIASIERLQDGVISRMVPPSQAITTPANDPNTIIEGFDNNSAQTITIKIS